MPSFTHALRARGEDGLVALLAARPDLAAPPPSTVRSLATRAANRTSLERVLAAADTRTLHVLESVVALSGSTAPGAPADDAAPAARAVPLAEVHAALAGAEVDDVRAAVAGALTAALLWTPEPTGTPATATDVALLPAPGLAELLGPHPAGLGPSLRTTLARRSRESLERLAAEVGLPAHAAPDAVPDALDPAAAADGTAGLVARLAAHLAAPDVVERLLGDDPRGPRAVLAALAWGPPVGRSPESTGTSPARAAVDRALRLGLLAVSDAQHVVLPREVALALRGGRTHRDHAAPALGGRVVDAGTVAAESAQHAEHAVRLTAGLVELWGAEPAPALRSGGLGQRELRRAAVRLETTDAVAALVVELAGAAGLVLEDGEEAGSLAPGPAADDWLALPLTERWAVLADAWMRSERAAWLVGTRDERGALRPALDPESRRPWAPRLRISVLSVLADAPAGTAPTPDSVHALLQWRTPRSAPPQHAVAAVLDEAQVLGVLGAGALARAGAALLAATDDGVDVTAALPADPAAALAAQLPPPVDEVLLQGDLTGVVPGRPSEQLAALLEESAQVESRGAALTVRFTEASVRRALDVGRTAEDLLAALSRHARSGVPQPLEYLVLDTARRHGLVRVGMASSYLRSDDPALLAGLVEDPALRGLGLLRLAPTVMAAQATPAALLAALRARGLAPVTEGPSGQVVLGPVAGHRVRPAPGRRRRETVVVEAREARERRLHRVARDLLAADRREQARVGDGAPSDDGMPAPDPVLGLDLLREAASEGREVWLEMVDPHGASVRRRVRPVRVDAGRVRLLDAERETEMTVAVHRIGTVTPA